MAAKTVFHARGEPAEMTAFIETVCRTLADLPLDRIPLESQVLRTEGAAAPARAIATMLGWFREGTRGLGLTGALEHFLQAPDPQMTAAWALSRFTTGNAALMIAGDLPPGLSLPLPPGPRSPAIELRSVPNLVLPAVTVVGPGGIGISFVVERATPMAMVLRIAASRMHQELRLDRGLSYAIGYDYQPIDAERAHAVLWATCLDDQASAVETRLLGILNDLATDGPTPEDLARDIADYCRATTDEAAVPHRLEGEAFSELLGAPSTKPVEYLEQMRTVTPAGAAEAMTAAMKTALLLLPTGAPYPGPSFHPYPGPFVDLPDGQTFDHVSRKFPWTRNTPRLIIGPEGIAVVDPGLHTVAIRWDACAVVLAGENGVRTITGEDGYSVTVVPAYWRDGDRASRLVDDLTPAGRGVSYAA